MIFDFIGEHYWLRAVNKKFKNYIDANYKFSENEFILMCRAGRIDLIEKYEPFNYEWGFQIACEEKNLKTVKYMLSKCDLEFVSEDGIGILNIGLFGACESGATEVVKYLIDSGADDYDDGLIGACRGGHIETFELMVNCGANSWNGGLSGACEGGQIEFVEKLINLGATNINDGAEDAIYADKFNVVKLLIEKYGASNFDYLLCGACVSESAEKKDMIAYLLDKGGDPNSGLEGASNVGDFETVLLMIEKGATDFNPAIYNAIAGDQLKMVEFLISHECDLKLALNRAIDRDKLDMVKLIISKGLQITNEMIERAIDRDHSEIAEYLKSPV